MAGVESRCDDGLEEGSAGELAMLGAVHTLQELLKLAASQESRRKQLQDRKRKLNDMRSGVSRVNSREHRR